MKPNVAKCLLITKVIVADGVFSDGERAFLDGAMRKLGLTDEERESVLELEGWAQAEPLVAGLSVEEKREFLSLLVDAASADGQFNAPELAAVKRITAALGLA